MNVLIEAAEKQNKKQPPASDAPSATVSARNRHIKKTRHMNGLFVKQRGRHWRLLCRAG